MIACLYSGGKDSTLAMHIAAKEGMRAELLITLIPDNEYSYMFHRPNIEYTALQAEAMGLRHVFSRTSGEKEAELDDLEKALVSNNVGYLITGATSSEYQRSRIAAICKRNSIEMLSPLWGIDPRAELNELSENYNAIITRVAAEGFTKDMLGKRIDKDMVERLLKLNIKYGTNPLFEGGEAESFVLDAPMFKKRIAIEKAEIKWKNNSGDYLILAAHLESKEHL
ncbi:MAG: diphthine--ammonia ligase [Candidatus Micrarchaeaceae archaeon]